MNTTMSDEEFNNTIEDASTAVIEAVNTLLFDRYGKGPYTAAQRDHELNVVLMLVKGYTTEQFVWGNLDVIVSKPVHNDYVAEEVTCERCGDLFTRRVGDLWVNCTRCD